MVEDTTRRRVLGGVGVAFTTQLAGCTDDGDDGESGGDSMDDEDSMENDSMTERTRCRTTIRRRPRA